MQSLRMLAQTSYEPSLNPCSLHLPQASYDIAPSLNFLIFKLGIII